MKKIGQLLILVLLVTLINGCGAYYGLNTELDGGCYGYVCAQCDWVQWYNDCDNKTKNHRCPYCDEYIFVIFSKEF